VKDTTLIKKGGILFVIILIFTFVIIQPSTVHAQTVHPDTGAITYSDGSTASLIEGQYRSSNRNYTGSGQSEADRAVANGNVDTTGLTISYLSPQEQAEYDNRPPNNHNGECWGAGVLPGSNFIDLGNCINQIAYITFSTLAIGVEGAGSVMDKSFEFSVLKIRENLIESGVGSSIKAGWVIFRDVANITLIFVMLYLAISIIVGLGGDSKKAVGRVIIVAILINFSFFITSLVIDTSNILAIQFSEKITAENTTIGTDRTEKKYGEIFLQTFKIGVIFDAGGSGGQDLFDNAQAFAKDAQRSKTASIFNFVGGSILLITAIFVFLAAAVLLFVRFIALAFLLLLSPLAFVASVLPKTQQYFKKWTNKLLSEAFYAPAFFMFLWFSITFITSEGFKTAVGDKQKSIFNTGSSSDEATLATVISVAIAFILGIGFLVGSIIAGKMLGATGASTAVSAGKSLRQWGQGVAGRNTIGLAGRGLSKGFEGTARKYGNTGFSKTGGGRILGSLANIGTRGTRDTLRKAEGAKFGSSQSLASIRQSDKDAQERYKKAGIEGNRDERIGLATDAILGGDQEKIRDEIGKLSPTELDEIIENKGLNFVLGADDTNAHALAGRHLEAIKGSDVYSEGDKQKIKKAHEKAFGELAKNNQGLFKSAIEGMKSSDTAKLPASVLKDASEYLSAATLGQILKGGSIKDTDRGDIRSKIEASTGTGKQIKEAKKWLKDNKNGEMF